MKFFRNKDLPVADSSQGEGSGKQRIESLREEVDKYAGFRDDIFGQMLERNKPEYKWFIMGIRLFKRLSRSSFKGQFLENYYIAMRYIDDIADGDAPIPSGYRDGEQYISKKLEYISSGAPPADDCENLLALCFKLAKEFGADFIQETDDILRSLQFDGRRRGKYQVFPEQELEAHFFELDIRGGIRGTLKVFGESPEHDEILRPLGEADRIYYNLRDFKEDTAVGLINVPAEDCARLGITADLLKSGQYADHEGLRTWFREQANKGLALIEAYHKKREEAEGKGAHFQLITQAALKFGFEMKAKKFMTDVAKGDFTRIFERSA